MFRSIAFGNNCCCPRTSPIEPPPPPPVVEPVDWLKCGAKAHCDAMECWTETPIWMVCSNNCETIDFAVKIRATLGGIHATMDQTYKTQVIADYQAFIVRREEWKKHVQLGECPQRGWSIYVECTKQWYVILPDEGFPPFENFDAYNFKWRIHSKCQKPCFEWTPPI